MKVFVLGVKRMTGLSKKTQNPYDFAQVIAALPLRPVSRENFEISGYGFEPAEFECHNQAVRQFEGLQLPALVELETAHEPGRNGMRVVVTGVKAVTSAPKAASA